VTAGAADATEPASSYDRPGATHNTQCVPTKSDAAVAVRDAEGRQLVNDHGAVTSTPEQREACAAARVSGLQLDGLEAVSAGGAEAFYSWPGDPVRSQSEGFIAASELAGRPLLDAQDEAENGRPAPDAPGSPVYRITPIAFDNAQEYFGEASGRWYAYDPYGLSTGGARYALMTWSWVDVAGGGIGRATVAEGAQFFPSDVEPIETTTYGGSLERPNGSVTARYGRIATGAGPLYGWMVMSHTDEGSCVDHMAYAGGGPPLPHALCGLSAASAAYGEGWEWLLGEGASSGGLP
jgi:hypothetical protein